MAPRKVQPRASGGPNLPPARLRRPPPLAVTWRPALPTRPRAWGGGRGGRRAAGSRVPPPAAPPEPHLGARPASRRGRARATGHVLSHLGSKSTNGLCRKNVLCSGNYHTDIRDAGLKKKKVQGNSTTQRDLFSLSFPSQKSLAVGEAQAPWTSLVLTCPTPSNPTHFTTPPHPVLTQPSVGQPSVLVPPSELPPLLYINSNI